MKRRRPMDIAIVGMACRFPGARDLVAYWENIVAARDCTSEVPADRWDPAVFVDRESTANDRVYCSRGGYLDAPIAFDPGRFGIMPLAVAGGEPEQFLVLDTAEAALADAGLAEGTLDGRRVEVVIGRGNYFNRGNLTRLQHGRVVAQTLAILGELHPEWTEAEIDAVRADLKASLPPFEAGTIAGQLTNATAGRVASRLDLRGASFVVDAASASSLVALDLAARALVERRADLALAGGVYLAVDVDFPMVFSQLGALSRSGRARPFAQDADGTLPGEGVGVVVLKRLSDAERAGDRIYAVLKGVGLASDGGRRGLAKPSARGHALAIRRAYRRAAIDPGTVAFVEGHGLGVPAADRAELRALRAVFPRSRWGKRTLGAVSVTIGHAMPAAGMAALIKSALALHNRVLPATPGADAPHPLLGDDASPFQLGRETRPWVHGDRAHPRRAGVSALGFGGINAHAVLEEHSPSADGPAPGAQPRWETEAILLSAADRAGLIERARRLAGWLERDSNRTVPLKDLACTLNTREVEGPCRLGLVAGSTAELRDRLVALAGRLEDPACAAIRDARGTYFWQAPLAADGAANLAFLFPGEGSQYPGMLADLCPHFPEVRGLFDVGDRLAIEEGSPRLPSEVLFGCTQAADAGLWTIGTAINTVMTAQWALYRLLTGLGLRPDAVAGHSSGEFLALAAAGVLNVDAKLESGLGRLGRLFETLESSGRVPAARLLAVAADRVRVKRVCAEVDAGLALAIDNCPHQVVVAGPGESIDRLAERLRAQGLMCERLPFERAYHTPAFAPALEPVRDFFNGLRLEPPRTRLYSCAVAGRLAGDVEAIRRIAVEQWALPVAFRDTVEAMYADGARVFVDVGARGNLAGFVEDILRGRPHFAIGANLPRRSGLTQLNHLVASLFAQGVAVRPERLYSRRGPSTVDLDRDRPAARQQPALAVGFPEMRLSPGLAARLREPAQTEQADIQPEQRSDEACPTAAPTHLGNGNGHAPLNGHVRSHDNDGMLWTQPPATPTPAVDPGEHEEAMLSHLRTLDEFLETQRQVMAAYWESCGASAAPATPLQIAVRDDSPLDPTPSTPEAGPWVGTIQEWAPGRSLVALRTLELAGDPVAESHTLGGRRISELDPDRKGLPVLPFTVMAEMLAQAAVALVPGLVVIALRDVQAHKWLRYEEEPVTLEIRAERLASTPDQVQVRIINRGTLGSTASTGEGPFVEGTVVLAAAREPGPAPRPFAAEGARACRFTEDDLYDDQWLFHGPPMQAVAAVGRSSPGGIEGTLRTLPRGGLLRPSERPGLCTDPILLDAFTQLLGCWGLDWLSEGDVIFPLRVAEIAFFGADPPEGTDVAIRIAIRDASTRRVRADADLSGPDGRVWARFTGWEDWRFYWPNRCRDQFRQPDRFYLGEPLEVAGTLNNVDPSCAIQAVWLEPPADLGKPIWRDVAERVQLAPRELAAHRDGLDLWQRAALKEAARRLWTERGAAPIYPADLEVERDAEGRPRVRCLVDRPGLEPLATACASLDGGAVAIATLPADVALGVAAAPIGERPRDYEGDDETLLDSMGLEHPARAEWQARFDCARAAVLDAIGRAYGIAPSSIAIVAADVATGEVVTVVPPGPVPARVATSRRGEHVWAWTCRPRIETMDRIGGNAPSRQTCTGGAS